MKRFFAFILSIFFIAGCSVSDYQSIAKAALSSDPVSAAQNIAINKGVQYAANPSQVVADIKHIKENFQEILSVFIGEAAKEWGEDNVEVPSRKVYVKYTQDYKSRAEVNFDEGTVKVSTIDDQEPLKSLQNAIITTILTPENPEDVDLYSAKPVELKGDPFLKGLILDHDGKVVLYQWRANRYAEYLIENKLQTGTITVEGKSVKLYSVTFPMVKGKDNVSAQKYKSLVRQYAIKNGLEESLVYAIIKTESAFNPYAVSGAPAYGLMQIVPSTAGRDVYRKLHGSDGVPTKNQLFDPRTNIEYGTTYLNILFKSYLEGVQNPTSREYCVISAYNGGAGNVFKTFGGSKNTALGQINSLAPSSVYWKLKTKHPFEESRNYVVKVTNAKKEFIRY